VEARRCIVCQKLWPITNFNVGATICHSCANKSYQGHDTRTWKDRKLCKGCGRTTFLYGKICETCKRAAAAAPKLPKPIKPTKPKRPPRAILIKRLVTPIELRAAFFTWYGQFCRVCHENHPECLAFHHIDPTQKTNQVSKLWLNPDASHVLSELSKCVLICCNCHARVHAKTLDISTLPPINSTSFAIYAQSAGCICDNPILTAQQLICSVS
jgi:hypothetical protein